MQPKVEINKIRDFGRTIDDAILFFKQNLKPLFKNYAAICGIFWIAALLVSCIAIRTKPHYVSGFTAGYFWAIMLEVLNYIMMTLTTVAYIAIYYKKNKETPTLQEVWDYVKYYFWRVLFSHYFLAVLLTIGFFICVIPFVYLWPVFCLIMPIMVIENAGMGYAFNRAFKMLSNNWWHALGIKVVMGLLMLVALYLFLTPNIIAAYLIIFLKGNDGNLALFIAQMFTVHLAWFLAIPVTISTTLLYFSLIEEQDNHTLLERIEAIGTHDQQLNAQHHDEEEEY